MARPTTPRAPSTARRLLAAAALAATPFTVTLFAGAGCAVTTIDVDVYKGPLSNEEGVQTEQVASLAIAARPLLVQLRNTLAADRIECLRKCNPNNIDVNDFIGPGPKQFTVFDQKHEVHANRVNALLSLYKDRQPPPGLARMLDRGQQLVQQYREHVVRLDSKDADTPAH
jgi:hypothetical protein